LFGVTGNGSFTGSLQLPAEHGNYKLQIQHNRYQIRKSLSLVNLFAKNNFDMLFFKQSIDIARIENHRSSLST
jgi:hypothetical protein